MGLVKGFAGENTMVNRMGNSQKRIPDRRLTRAGAGGTVSPTPFFIGLTMRHFLRPALCLPLLALAACDEIAVADAPAALADLRGQKSCLAAVRSETGVEGVAINTTRPMVERYRHIVHVPGGGPWA